MRTKSLKSPQNRWWDFPALFLIFIILTIAFTRLVATDWTEDLTVTRSIAYLGLIAGVALGFSRFSPRWVFTFALIYGLFVIPWRVGQTLGESIEWQERLLSLLGRLELIFTHLIQRRAVPDNLLFLVLMAILFWILSTHAGYHLVRYANPWISTLPVGIAIVLIHTYDSFYSNRVWYLVAYLFFALLLVARTVYLHNRARWTQAKTYMPPYFGFDFIRIAIIAGIVLTLLAWSAPALAQNIPAAQQAWQRFKQPWNDVRNTLDNAFSSLRSSAGMPSEFYGATASLGRGTLHSDSQVFTVITPENIPEGIRLYWRARIYDEYQDGQWTSTLDGTRAFDPERSELDTPEFEGHAPGFYSFLFTTTSPLASIFTVNQPVWVSRPARAEMAENPDGTIDLSHLRATPSIRAGESYTARSKLNRLTVASLRLSGTDYPEWITDRYLQLPENITPRTLQLARDITADLETPYDKTLAITGYLRNAIEYSETITAPLPINQEPIDWFLFDVRQGFCNYYATSQVLLLRAVGVPARIAFGYARGEIIEGTSAFSVRELDAHAWPEVYFPGFGWVEFEPTGSQPDIVRPAGIEADDELPTSPLNLGREDELIPSSSLRPEPDATSQPAANNLTGYLVLAATAGLLVILIMLFIPVIRRKRLLEKIPPVSIMLERSFRKIGVRPPALIGFMAHKASLSPIAKSYMEISLALARLGRRPAPSDTPKQRAEQLKVEIPVVQAETDTLLHEYQLATYSMSHNPNIPAADQAGKTIRRLSYRAYIQKLLSRE
jgi:transglutaminase-like putative cysteine protease